MTDQTATKPRHLTLTFDKGRTIRVTYEFFGWKEDEYTIDTYAKDLSQIIVDGLTDE